MLLLQICVSSQVNPCCCYRCVCSQVNPCDGHRSVCSQVNSCCCYKCVCSQVNKSMCLQIKSRIKVGYLRVINAHNINNLDSRSDGHVHQYSSIRLCFPSHCAS